MKLDVYKKWVDDEVGALDPAVLTDNWATAWEKTLSPMPTSGVDAGSHRRVGSVTRGASRLASLPPCHHAANRMRVQQV